MVYGRLSVVCGPMFGGKTTELLKRILWACSGENRKVMAVKTAFDTRYDATKLVSHDGLSFPAQTITSWDEVADMAEGMDLIAIDEVQFFAEPNFQGDLVAIVRDLLSKGKDIVAGGLDMDWRGEPFPVTAKLAAMADDLIKVTANCTICGRPARKTFKKAGGESRVELGTTDIYEARCNTHWRGYGS